MNPLPQTLASRLRSLKPELSWQKCRDLITQGFVTVDQQVFYDPTLRIQEHQVVEILKQPQKFSKIKEQIQQNHLKVYHYDEHLIVLEKPSGIESVPFHTKERRLEKSSSQKTLQDLAKEWLQQQENRTIPPLKVVHRLDKGTSGVMMFARTKLAEVRLGQIFRDHSLTRSYTAFCFGTPKDETISTRLVQDRGDGKRGSTKNPKLGKPATTIVTCLETKKISHDLVFSKVECLLETGRTHQIRIHLSERGHPLCGENVYLPAKFFDVITKHKKDLPSRIALHAKELGITHPVTEEKHHWISDLPEDLQKWWSK